MVREILVYPDPVLKQKAKPVAQVDDSVRELVRDMVETMYSADGVGLAAPQVGVLKRIIVIDPAPGTKESKLYVFINPEIVSADGRTKYTEGCLSIPGESEEIERFEKLTVRALDEQGETFEVEAEGLLAIALQHEIDHLDGVLFVDRLSSLKRGLIRKRMLKYKTDQRRGQVEKPAAQPGL